LQESIVPLIEQVLVKKLGQAMTFAAEQLVQPKREWVGLTDEESNELWESTDSDWELMKRTEAKLKEKNT
jgi:hypothetical protein